MYTSDEYKNIFKNAIVTNVNKVNLMGGCGSHSW